jgi:hypothetical protein
MPKIQYNISKESILKFSNRQSNFMWSSVLGRKGKSVNPRLIPALAAGPIPA